MIEYIERAWDKRKKFAYRLEKEKTDTFRLFGGDPEGIPGLFVDQFGPVVMMVTYPDQCPLGDFTLTEIATWYPQIPGIRSVYHKRFQKTRKEDPSLFSPQPLVGKMASSEFCVMEYGRKFLIRPYDGFSVGLFIDQRENRNMLAEGVSGCRILNGFSYTCGFSVACALSGAETVSVDISPKNLEWGKENFHSNGILLSRHQFIAEDIFDYLRCAKRGGEKFDRVILDPPSFSRNRKGKVFSVKKDFARLIEAASHVLLPKGHLFFSTNYSKWKMRDLKERMRAVLGTCEFLQLPDLPIDFRLGVAPHVAVRVRRN